MYSADSLPDYQAVLNPDLCWIVGCLYLYIVLYFLSVQYCSAMGSIYCSVVGSMQELATVLNWTRPLAAVHCSAMDCSVDSNWTVTDNQQCSENK